MQTPPKLSQEQAIALAKQNCELLRLTFNTLQGMIKEMNIEKNGLAHCNAFTLASCTKTVYERWEMERRKLWAVGSAPPSTEFVPPSELPFPADLRKEIAEKSHKSDYYTTLWGNLAPAGAK